MNLSEIAKPVDLHLKKFGEYFKSQLNTKVSLLNIVLRYITSRKGKQVRPTMVFLAAELCGGVNDRSYIGATLVELLHTATLTHDDVVDEASERRGIASINAKWNNKIAVLVGDFLLSRGLLAALDNNEFGFLKITSKAVKRMSEGELLSIERSKESELDEETYFQIIGDKTASLLSTCCEIGALSASDNPQYLSAMADYGEYVGMAFQIRDDIFDYVSKSSLIGKPVGNDLKEKKITLPLIYTLNQTDNSKGIVKKIKRGKLTRSEIKEIIELVISTGGIDYAESKAKYYVQKACDSIEFFPDSEAKQALLEFAEFVLTRNS